MHKETQEDSLEVENESKIQEDFPKDEDLGGIQVREGKEKENRRSSNNGGREQGQNFGELLILIYNYEAQCKTLKNPTPTSESQFTKSTYYYYTTGLF